jgi:hypothetical protein
LVLDGNCDGDEDDDDGGVDVLLGGLHINTSATDNEEFTEMPDDDEMDSGTQSHGGAAKPNASRSVPIGKAPPQERSTMPKWLSQDYADTRERLADEIRKNPSKRPTCYDQGTFIDGTPSAYFAADRKFQPLPEDFYRPRYFIWLPHLLVHRIPCPACVASNRKADDGGPVFLWCKGWARAPRRVVDLEECIYVVGYRYMCGHSACKRTYQSWSPALRAALPRSLAMEFTHHLTYRSGLTDRVVSLMRSSFRHGIGPGPFAELIRTNHLRRHEQLHLQYLEMVYARVQAPLARLLAKFEPFGDFDDRDGYAGFTPSANYFRDFYVNFISSHAGEMDQYTAMLSALLLEIDHSYKVWTSHVFCQPLC